MEDERTFTMDELVNFVIHGNYWTSFADALRFASEFAEDRGVELDTVDIRKRWANANGVSYEDMGL